MFSQKQLEEAKVRARDRAAAIAETTRSPSGGAGPAPHATPRVGMAYDGPDPLAPLPSPLASPRGASPRAGGSDPGGERGDSGGKLFADPALASPRAAVAAAAAAREASGGGLGGGTGCGGGASPAAGDPAEGAPSPRSLLEDVKEKEKARQRGHELLSRLMPGFGGGGSSGGGVADGLSPDQRHHGLDNALKPQPPAPHPAQPPPQPPPAEALVAALVPGSGAAEEAAVWAARDRQLLEAFERAKRAQREVEISGGGGGGSGAAAAAAAAAAAEAGGGGGGGQFDPPPAPQPSATAPRPHQDAAPAPATAAASSSTATATAVTTATSAAAASTASTAAAAAAASAASANGVRLSRSAAARVKADADSAAALRSAFLARRAGDGGNPGASVAAASEKFSGGGIGRGCAAGPRRHASADDAAGGGGSGGSSHAGATTARLGAVHGPASLMALRATAQDLDGFFEEGDEAATEAEEVRQKEGGGGGASSSPATPKWATPWRRSTANDVLGGFSGPASPSQRAMAAGEIRSGGFPPLSVPPHFSPPPLPPGRQPSPLSPARAAPAPPAAPPAPSSPFADFRALGGAGRVRLALVDLRARVDAAKRRADALAPGHASVGDAHRVRLDGFARATDVKRSLAHLQKHGAGHRGPRPPAYSASASPLSSPLLSPYAHHHQDPLDGQLPPVGLAIGSRLLEDAVRDAYADLGTVQESLERQLASLGGGVTLHSTVLGLNRAVSRVERLAADLEAAHRRAHLGSGSGADSGSGSIARGTAAGAAPPSPNKAGYPGRGRSAILEEASTLGSSLGSSGGALSPADRLRRTRGASPRPERPPGDGGGDGDDAATEYLFGSGLGAAFAAAAVAKGDLFGTSGHPADPQPRGAWMSGALAALRRDEARDEHAAAAAAAAAAASAAATYEQQGYEGARGERGGSAWRSGGGGGGGSGRFGSPRREAAASPASGAGASPGGPALRTREGKLFEERRAAAAAAALAPGAASTLHPASLGRGAGASFGGSGFSGGGFGGWALGSLEGVAKALFEAEVFLNGTHWPPASRGSVREARGAIELARLFVSSQALPRAAPLARDALDKVDALHALFGTAPPPESSNGASASASAAAVNGRGLGGGLSAHKAESDARDARYRAWAAASARMSRR